MSNFTDTIKSLRNTRQIAHQRWVRWMWFGLIGGFLATILFFVYLSFQDLPTFEDLENPNSNLASDVVGANNEVIGRYFIENRIAVSPDELCLFLKKAVVSTEDERFYEHTGIDFRAVARVIGKTFLLGKKSAGGGSTITQQLAKLLYSDRDFSGMNFLQKAFALGTTKFKEWITAVKLERSYTKEEIIAMYLNQFNFINGAYGVSAASEIYFNKNQKNLSLEEAAMLVGMLQNPALHNPIRRPQNALNRRNVVLSQMVKNNAITAAQFNAVKNKSIELHVKKNTHADGIAPYFRMELRKEVQAILDRPEFAKPDGSKYNIYKDGLKIYTTIDPIIQRHAEQAMREHMAQLQKRFFTVWKGKDPWTSKESNVAQSVRDEGLKRVIQESDRYQNMRTNYMDDIVQQAESEVLGLTIKDSDIEKLMSMDVAGGIMPKLMADKTLSPDKLSQYKQLIKGNSWGKLRAQWTLFQAAVRKSFATSTKMKIFAYNDAGEKDTIMSPLDSIKYHRMFLQMGSLSVDPTTGQVKSWIGGVNHKYFQFDHIRSNRQVGSTFKPFVYATAIAQQGISPCFQVVDMPYTIRPGEGNFKLIKSWTPGNSTGKYSGKSYTLKEALKESVNTVSVYLMRQLGDTGPVRGLVNMMGIDSSLRRPDGDYHVPKQPSICLGATDLSVYEMAGAYTAFADEGKYHKPIFITRIEDKNGRVIYTELPEEHLALNPGPNYAMVDMLKYVTLGAPGFEGLKSEVGGKTGTTNDFVDGWFMGITPKLVVGTWVGGEDRWIRFLSIADGQGAKMSRPFFAKFLKRLENDPSTGYDSNARFKRPAGDIGIMLDCDAYNAKTGQAAATTNTPGATGEEFFNNTFEEKNK